jgi:hypothetical protein
LVWRLSKILGSTMLEFAMIADAEFEGFGDEG